MMKLKDLFETFEYENRVIVVGSPCGWCNDEMRQTVDKNTYQEFFKDYLDCKVKSLDVATEVNGSCCGYDIEVAYLEITIE